jgi:hypothetical protein
MSRLGDWIIQLISKVWIHFGKWSVEYEFLRKVRRAECFLKIIS